MPRISPESDTDSSDPVAAGMGFQGDYMMDTPKDFAYWLKSGLAFTLPLTVLGVVIVVLLIALLNAGAK